MALVAFVAILVAAAVTFLPDRSTSGPRSKSGRPTLSARSHSVFTACASSLCRAYAIQLQWSNIPFSATTGYYLFANGSLVDSAAHSPYVFYGMGCGKTFTLGLEAHDASGKHSQLYTSHYTTPSCGCPADTRNTPGGPDRWGGCFPGPGNTGVPSNVRPVDVSGGNILPGNPAIPADNTGWTIDSGLIRINPGSVVDGVEDLNGAYVPDGGGGTVENSELGDINDISGSGSLTVENSTVLGGRDTTYSPITATGNGSSYGAITVDGVDASGGGHGVLCYSNCTVENSWLHNNSTSNPAAHQNSILIDGGSNDTITHNSTFCTGGSGCTADISLLSENDDVSISKNLLVASPPSAGSEQTGYCAYPGPNAPGLSGISGIDWTDNVFERGANGKCALNGPVYAWYPSTCSPDPCRWTGNVWNDGTAIEP